MLMEKGIGKDLFFSGQNAEEGNLFVLKSFSAKGVSRSSSL